MDNIIKVNMDRKAGIRMLHIRGFIGPIGSGKSYRTDKLVEDGYIKIDFADSLRSMVYYLLGWKPKNHKEYEKFKAGEIYIDNFGFVNGRLFLQRLGERMRKENPNFWVNKWKESVEEAFIKGYEKIVTTDIRHKNEVDAFKSFGFKTDNKIVFCNYKSERYCIKDGHVSEKLAQDLLQYGLKDGDDISMDLINKIYEN